MELKHHTITLQGTFFFFLAIPHEASFCNVYLFSAQDCGPLPVPANGSSVGDLTVFPNTILFSCDGGFNLRGSTVRHCKANGTWSGNQTFCEGFYYSLSVLTGLILAMTCIIIELISKITIRCNRLKSIL